MDSILRVLMPFFGPKNYSEMLWKIALADFWLALACTFLVRYDPWIDGRFLRFEHLPGLKEFAAAVKAPEVNIGGFALALVVLVFSRTTRFHDRVSDLFKIRARFDRANILLPLAVMSGVQMTARQIGHLTIDRHPLMREAFYKYASSRQETPLVDKHDIESALEAWHMYWVALEWFFIVSGFAIFSAVAGSFWLLVIFWIVSMALLLFMHLRYGLLERRVDPQIQKIAGNDEANAANRQVFEELAR
ncbi:MAG: hypothetical protein QOG67_3249 [Verrucomicrobiota bacterium]|jgi:hypothetical protein